MSLNTFEGIKTSSLSELVTVSQWVWINLKGLKETSGSTWIQESQISKSVCEDQLVDLVTWHHAATCTGVRALHLLCVWAIGSGQKLPCTFSRRWMFVRCCIQWCTVQVRGIFQIFYIQSLSPSSAQQMRLSVFLLNCTKVLRVHVWNCSQGTTMKMKCLGKSSQWVRDLQCLVDSFVRCEKQCTQQSLDFTMKNKNYQQHAAPMHMTLSIILTDLPMREGNLSCDVTLRLLHRFVHLLHQTHRSCPDARGCLQVSPVEDGHEASCHEYGGGETDEDGRVVNLRHQGGVGCSLRSDGADEAKHSLCIATHGVDQQPDLWNTPIEEPGLEVCCCGSKPASVFFNPHAYSLSFHWCGWQWQGYARIVQTQLLSY